MSRKSKKNIQQGISGTAVATPLVSGSAVAPAYMVGGKYQLEEIAGTGGMANVWRATMKGPGRFRRTVAVKHMHSHLKENTQYREMFFEEARVGAELQDGNIVQTYDFIEEYGEYFLIMEWIEGINLYTYAQYVNKMKSRTRWELAVAIGIGVLRGLSAAHEYVDDAGRPTPILHRDVSPHNILISEKGMAKLIDFGLALASDRLSAPTPPDVAKGKLSYMAPEVLQGGKATHLSDQFAVGNLLWETLAGRRLFTGESDRDVFNQIISGNIPPLNKLRPDVPKPLLKVIGRALSADPAKRYASARDMALELTNVLRIVRVQDDFYELLAQSVHAARVEFNLGRRTQAPWEDDESASEESEIAIELKDKTITRRFFEKITSFMR
ncbi:MAG: serine/threonine protein kinase [Deltaproteobacteria bacterium]|nr:serine/threonine protein kinase [Deltaproteobacteria bacterium]